MVMQGNHGYSFLLPLACIDAVIITVMAIIITSLGATVCFRWPSTIAQATGFEFATAIVQ